MAEVNINDNENVLEIPTPSEIQETIKKPVYDASYQENIENVHSNHIINAKDACIAEAEIADPKNNNCTRKKFYNTTFAKKMRNRSKEEKQKSMETKDAILNVCKPVTVNIIRLSSEVSLPKSVSTTESKVRKKKRSQWSLGVIKPKHRNKATTNRDNARRSISRDSNEDVKNILATSAGQLVKKRKSFEERRKETEDFGRRKSTRSSSASVSSEHILIEKQKLEEEQLEQNSSESQSSYSCKRTDPFIGKLNTKELRRDFIENFILTNKKPVLPGGERNDEKTDLINGNDTNTNKNRTLSKDNSFLENEQKPENMCHETANKNCNESAKPLKSKSKEKPDVSKTCCDQNTREKSKRRGSTSSASAKTNKTELTPAKSELPKINSTEKVTKVDKKESFPSAEKLTTVEKNVLSSKLPSDSIPDESKVTEKENNYSDSGSIFNSESGLLFNQSDTEDDNTTSCRRTEPFVGKGVPHCSRTVPFKPPFDKSHKIGTSIPTSIDSATNDKDISACNSQNDRNSLLGDSSVRNVDDTLFLKCNENSESNPSENKSDGKLKRKRKTTVTDVDSQEDNLKSVKKVKPTSVSTFQSPPTPTKKKSLNQASVHTICSFFSQNCTKHHHHDHHQAELGDFGSQENLKKIIAEKSCCIALTRLEDITNDAFITNWLQGRNEPIADYHEREENSPCSPASEIVNEDIADTRISSDVCVEKDAEDSRSSSVILSTNDINEVQACSSDVSDASAVSTVSDLSHVKRPLRKVNQILSDSEESDSISSAAANLASSESISPNRPHREQALLTRTRIWSFYEDEDIVDEEVEGLSNKMDHRLRHNLPVSMTTRSQSTYMGKNIQDFNDENNRKRSLRLRSRSQGPNNLQNPEFFKHTPILSQTAKSLDNLTDTCSPNSDLASNNLDNISERTKTSTHNSYPAHQPDVELEILREIIKKDVRVQLVKLESILGSLRKHYIAQEIDNLTRKYEIDNNLKFSELSHEKVLSSNNIVLNKNNISNMYNSILEEDNTSSSSSSLLPLESSSGIPLSNDTSIKSSDRAFNNISTLKSPKKSVSATDKELTAESSKKNVKLSVDTEIKQISKPDKAKDKDSMENTFSCKICFKVFVSQKSLSVHEEKVHKISCLNNQNSPKTNETAAALKKQKKRLKSSDSLTCTICSVQFPSREILFDHVIKHTESELQQAYKTAKAKEKQAQSEQQPVNNINDSSVANDNQTVQQDATELTSVPSDKIQELENSANAPPVFEQNLQQSVVSNDNSSQAVVICSCHANETLNLNGQDLQIEMVLQCKSCLVIFRRSDCIEIHYRTSQKCRQARSSGGHTKLPILLCSGCPFVLKSLPEMRTHLETHAKQNAHGTVTFICNICKVAFFGVGSIFYTHWFHHTKDPNFVASRYSFPKLSIVSVQEDSPVTIPPTKSDEGFFYIAEHVCRVCRLPFGSETDLQRHKQIPCQPQGVPNSNRGTEQNDAYKLQMLKIVCDLCKKYYVTKGAFDRHVMDRKHLKTPPTKYSNIPISPNAQAFLCSICKVINKSLEDLNAHWKKIHSPIREVFTCKTCNQMPSNDITSLTFEKFQRHCVLHHRSEVITCVVYYTTANYVCQLCQVGFDDDKSLSEHSKIHQNRTVVDPNTRQQQQIISIPANVLSTRTVNAPATSTPTTTVWIADPNIAADGGRKVHPVQLHMFENNVIATPINTQATISPMVNSSQARLNNVVPVINSNQIQPNNSSSVVSNLGRQVETILIDSRSNSPVVSQDNSTSISTLQSQQLTKNSTARKSFPSASVSNLVNPTLNSQPQLSDSETTNSAESGQDDLVTDKDSVATPQPFEVVLLNDDSTKNSEAKESNSVSATENKQPHATESSTKSFLRVRSVAELIQHHICSICNVNFDNLPAYELHMQEHQQSQAYSNSLAPVQVISPITNDSLSAEIPMSNQVTNDASNSSQQQYWFASCNSSTPINSAAEVINSSQYQHQSTLRTVPLQSPRTSASKAASTNVPNSLLVNALRTQQPPSYTNNQQRGNSSIQLPERNNPTANKRPSGAATRIPQTLSPNQVNQPGNQNNMQNSYNHFSGGTVLSSQLIGANQQQVNPAKTAAINQTSQNMGTSALGNKTQPRVLYTCKYCAQFTSENPALVRQHERVYHVAELKQQQQQSIQQQQQTLQHQQQQIRVQASKHVPVNQMPERSRHAIPSRIVPSTNDSMRYICRICNTRFLTNNELLKHIEIFHKTPMSQVCCYVCDYCSNPLIFESEEQLRAHMDLSHNHSCEICGKRFPSNTDLMIHMNVHARNVSA